ncbi:o-succinylbenzoate synthase [Rariglobus hedericola]|uniref:o-succinylbenzoate synthase n=1 Tax=Rariglobus hedericola TaxID=2597822 RepID=A0A556QQQ7_9BACT|nr:o-succinylbenzoate synthase [Rariglobus hedericola]TSJ78978.1 o-succinylbenzoate synthase [Rariglobus hedericola]
MRLRLAYRRYLLPFRTPVRTAHGVWAEREGVLVRLTDESGRAGHGEAAPIPWFGTETPDEIEAALASFGEWVTEEQLVAVPARLGCLRFAIAGALSALRGSESSSDAGHAYLPVAALLPAGRAVLTAVAAKAELGFRTFKWKVGVGDPADELAILDDLLGQLPAGARLRLDANGGWDARVARRWLERTADRPIEYIEQPCFAGKNEDAGTRRRMDDVLRGLAEDYPTPLALDESLVGAQDVEHWLAEGWRGVFVIKPALFGDPTPVMARLAAAKADVVFSSALETAVGARAALQLALAWPGEKPRALGFGVWPLFHESVFDGPYVAPFIRKEDVEKLNAEAVWNALT